MRERKSQSSQDQGNRNLGDLVSVQNLKKGRGGLKAPKIPHVSLTPNQVDYYRDCYHALWEHYAGISIDKQDSSIKTSGKPWADLELYLCTKDPIKTPKWDEAMTLYKGFLDIMRLDDKKGKDGYQIVVMTDKKLADISLFEKIPTPKQITEYTMLMRLRNK